MKYEFKFCDISDKKIRLDKYLSSKINDISRGQIQYLIKNNHVYINNSIVNDCNYKLVSELNITVDYDKSDFAQISLAPYDIPLHILYEDDDVVVINKPSGLVVHPSPGSLDKTLVNALMFYTNGNLAHGLNNTAIDSFRPGIVHRIDKDTSGVLVVAKTTSALINLQKQFEDHSIHRIYYALCFGKPKVLSDRIETMIAYNPKTQKQIVHRIYKGKKTRTAITNYETVNIFNINNKYISLIRLKLETGRTHQIRVHMNHIGNPVIGDKIYGDFQKSIKGYDIKTQRILNSIERHLLHASELGFIHPRTKNYLIFKSDLPSDMEGLINFCKNNSRLDI